jgi:hypothetical protein
MPRPGHDPVLEPLPGGGGQRRQRDDGQAVAAGAVEGRPQLEPAEHQAVVGRRDREQQAGGRHEVEPLVGREIVLVPILLFVRAGHLIESVDGQQS